MGQNAKRDDDRPVASGVVSTTKVTSAWFTQRQQHGQERPPQRLRINGLIGQKATDGALLAAGLRPQITRRGICALATLLADMIPTTNHPMSLRRAMAGRAAPA